jgi:hypothetical protein
VGQYETSQDPGKLVGSSRGREGPNENFEILQQMYGLDHLGGLSGLGKLANLPLEPGFASSCLRFALAGFSCSQDG